MAIEGLPALTIVASKRVWVEANFKETELAKMLPGQRAEEVSKRVATPLRSRLSARRRVRSATSKFCRVMRSEEHTSALQSLMRNSYAVVCLKKKLQR